MNKFGDFLRTEKDYKVCTCKARLLSHKIYPIQGMTDRRSFDRDRRSFFRDREVIGDLHLKKDRKVIGIAKYGDRDLAIADRKILCSVF